MAIAPSQTSLTAWISVLGDSFLFIFDLFTERRVPQICTQGHRHFAWEIVPTLGELISGWSYIVAGACPDCSVGVFFHPPLAVSEFPISNEVVFWELCGRVFLLHLVGGDTSASSVYRPRRACLPVGRLLFI
jgi:hypothetical protein